MKTVYAYLPPKIIRRTFKPLSPVFPFTSLVPIVFIFPEPEEGSLEVPAATGLGKADDPPYFTGGFSPLATGALVCMGAAARIFDANTTGTRFGPMIPTAGGAF
jgi:hypothetical protein